MSRYIDADKLADWVKEFYPNDRQFLSAVLNAPTADVVEVRHREWKKLEHGGYVCSECDCWLEDYYGATPEMMKYCFKCGAKMDGERREE